MCRICKLICLSVSVLPPARWRIYGNQWISIEIDSDILKSIGIHRNLLISMNICWYPLQYMDSNWCLHIVITISFYSVDFQALLQSSKQNQLRSPVCSKLVPKLSDNRMSEHAHTCTHRLKYPSNLEQDWKSLKTERDHKNQYFIRFETAPMTLVNKLVDNNRQKIDNNNRR